MKLLLKSLSMNLEIMGEHVRAEEIDRKSIKASLSCRRVWDIHYKIYDILWNEKEIQKEKQRKKSEYGNDRWINEVHIHQSLCETAFSRKKYIEKKMINLYIQDN